MLRFWLGLLFVAVFMMLLEAVSVASAQRLPPPTPIPRMAIDEERSPAQLGDRGPMVTAHNTGDRAGRHTIYACQGYALLSTSAPLDDFLNVVVGELGGGASAPAAHSVWIRHPGVAHPATTSLCCYPATLGHHVSHIVQMSAKEEMARANTGAVITFMQHIHSIRDWAVSQFPNDTMSRDTLSVLPATFNLPIAARAFRCCPNPAGTDIVADKRAIFIHFGPKASCDIYSPCERATCHAAEFSCRDGRELLATVSTEESYAGDILAGHGDLLSDCDDIPGVLARRPGLFVCLIIPAMGGQNDG